MTQYVESAQDRGYGHGHVHGAFTSAGSILVLFILLVIVMCGVFC
ncbi:YjcZ family sporulation protein [Paenibacillus solisilvae]|uniref:YjcZ family sporulation protein n=1 Tax=Paenibacillus solisilvae TaxID=2486751 RepID=A0ABW0W2P8_9BACL